MPPVDQPKFMVNHQWFHFSQNGATPEASSVVFIELSLRSADSSLCSLINPKTGNFLINQEVNFRCFLREQTYSGTIYLKF